MSRHQQHVVFLSIYTNDNDTKKAFISSFSVVPKFHSAGISQKLMNYAINHSLKKGMDYIELEINKTIQKL